MITIEQFKDLFQNTIDDFHQHTYLLAVSGGSDSMVLAYLFLKNQIPFQVAHVNYHLREENSDLDQKLVEDFCIENNIKYHIYEVSEKDEKPEGSIQLWARNLRYRFFDEVMLKENLTSLATAHHLNDQLETFIINLSRGSGIKGLSGMPNHQHLVRPLLHYSKEEIYDFAKEHMIPFREDASNKKNDYLRNKIRNTITPLLMDINPQFLNQFDKSIQLLQEVKSFALDQTEKIFKEISFINHNEIIIDKTKFQAESSFLQYSVLNKYGFNNSEEHQKIFSAQTGSQFQSNEYCLTIDRNSIIINPLDVNNSDIESEEIILVENKDSLNQNLIINIADYVQNEIQDKEWYFELEKISFPLKLRHKKEGDIFHPIGMNGKKKVSKFFKDEKISILAKQKIWILVDGNDSILGILPFRQDQRMMAKSTSYKKLTLKY